MVDRIAAKMQQLDGFVEAGGVGGVRGADREDPLDPITPVVSGQDGLASPHPVAVAHDRVDLTVVGQEPVGMGQRPRREGVGGESGMDQRQGTLDPIVGQVGEEGPELGRGQHSLVDNGAAAEAGEVDLVAGQLGQLVFDPLAGDIDHTVEVEACLTLGSSHKYLVEGGHHPGGLAAQIGGVDRHLAPAEHAKTLGGHDLLDHLHDLVPLTLIVGQEADTRGVLAGRRETRHQILIQAVGHLEEDAGPVAGVGLRVGRPPMLQAGEGFQGISHDLVAPPPVQVGHEGHAAGVVLKRGVVESLGLGRGRQASSPVAGSDRCRTLNQPPTPSGGTAARTAKQRRSPGA